MPRPVQLSLFPDTSRKILAAGGFVAGMKASMRGIVAASGLSRAQVVDAMNDIVRATGKGLGKGSKLIKLETLEKWLASEERGQLPDLWGMHVLMLACASNIDPLKTWATQFDCAVLDGDGLDKLEFAELELERESRDKRRRELKTRLLGKQ